MAYIDSWNLSQDPIFKGRVAIAIVTAASQIYGEAPSEDPIKNEKRAALAFAVLRDPLTWQSVFALAVCSNAAITDSSNDGDIQYTVNSLWNDLAGV